MHHELHRHVQCTLRHLRYSPVSEMISKWRRTRWGVSIDTPNDHLGRGLIMRKGSWYYWTGRYGRQVLRIKGPHAAETCFKKTPPLAPGVIYSRSWSGLVVITAKDVETLFRFTADGPSRCRRLSGGKWDIHPAPISLSKFQYTWLPMASPNVTVTSSWNGAKRVDKENRWGCFEYRGANPDMQYSVLFIAFLSCYVHSTCKITLLVEQVASG